MTLKHLRDVSTYYRGGRNIGLAVRSVTLTNTVRTGDKSWLCRIGQAIRRAYVEQAGLWDIALASMLDDLFAADGVV